MLSKINIESITDKIGYQVYLLRSTLGERINSTSGSISDISESIQDIVETVWQSSDKETIDRMSSNLSSLQSKIDWRSVCRNNYESVVKILENLLKTDDALVSNGYVDFIMNNSGMRYCSEFARLLKLCGITFYNPWEIFYDKDDILGTLSVSGSGTGEWSGSSFEWSNVENIYSVQPTSGIELETTTQIGVSDIEVSVIACNFEDEEFSLSATILAESLSGTSFSLTSQSPFEKYVKFIKSVSISGGTSGDAFYVRFKPLRVISL